MTAPVQPVEALAAVSPHGEICGVAPARMSQEDARCYLGPMPAHWRVIPVRIVPMEGEDG